MCEIQICLTSCRSLLIMPKEFILFSHTLMHTSIYLHACMYATKLLHSLNHFCLSSLNSSIVSGKILSIPHNVAAPVTPWAWRTFAGFQLCKEISSRKQPQIGHITWGNLTFNHFLFLNTLNLVMLLPWFCSTAGNLCLNWACLHAVSHLFPVWNSFFCCCSSHIFHKSLLSVCQRCWKVTKEVAWGPLQVRLNIWVKSKQDWRK